MSRYLAFVFLALSASSVLAAPQGFPADAVSGTIDTATNTAGSVAGAITGTVSGVAPGSISARAPAELPQFPPVPDTTTLTRPVLGERSNSKVYSSAPLRKRDWQYPTSTKDCQMSEIPEKSKGLSYTHDGQEYSQDCLSRLALSVPSEERKSCRATGSSYDEECLFKKAFDEDWKFDVEKAKEDELAWRAAHPSSSSSQSWSNLYPSAVSDCRYDPRTMGRMQQTDGWSPYFAVPESDILLEIDCLLRLILDADIILDLEICPASARTSELLEIDAAIDILLGGRSTTELAPSHDSRDIVGVVLSVLAALRLGCLLDIILKIILAVGIEAQIVAGPLGVLELVVDLLAILL